MSYVPKIFLCGDKEEFYSRVDKYHPCKIVGVIEQLDDDGYFLEDGSCYIKGKIYRHKDWERILKNDVDYIIFNHLRDLIIARRTLKATNIIATQFFTVDQFSTFEPDIFYDVNLDMQLMRNLKNMKVKRLLDFNGYFIHSQIFTNNVDDVLEIDGIYTGNVLPVKENIYAHIYKDFAECCLKHYDAALIYTSSYRDFDVKFMLLENVADTVIIFARYGSELRKHIQVLVKNFNNVKALSSPAGEWLICRRHKPVEDFAMYVVTHKSLPDEHIDKLPSGYRLIHAGRALAQDLGYIGDDTGDNISKLNPYINEITALYWIWKNTSHTVIGLSHYRRFFTEATKTDFAHDNILTSEAIYKLLNDYDIIVTFHHSGILEFENIANMCSFELESFAETIIKQYLMRVQPDYLEAFEYVMHTSTVLYRCNMFVARKFVFDAYCAWLFSFYIDAVDKVLNTVDFNDNTNNQRRIMGYFAERMLTVWIIKNRLRVKELNIVQVLDM